MSTLAAPSEERRLFGIGIVMAAYLLLTGIDSSAKWLALGGVSAVQIVFIRYAGHLLLVMAINVPQSGFALLRTANLRIQVLRAAMLLGSTICNFIALRYLPLTVTGSIAFTMPLIICALSVPLLGETVGWRRWTAIAIGFVGVLIIVRPGTEAFHPAALLSFLSAGFAALYFLLTRRMAGSDSAATQQFYASLLATIVVLPFAIPAWSWPTEPSIWVASFTVALFGFAGHQLLTVASSFAPASVLAPFSYFQIIFLAVLSWVLFNQPPDIWLYLGAPIVIGSGLYIWLRERSLHKAANSVAELARS
jgi:drug/metabolite transporter (DMT)-like permease